MNKLLLTIALCLTIACGAFGQAIITEHGKQSDEIFLKLRKIDLLDQLLPLLLTKDQINHNLLPAIEQARSKMKQILTDEDTELAKFDAETTEVLNNAMTKDVYPPKDFLKRVAAKTRDMSIKRSVNMSLITADLAKILDATLTDGQKKVMENSFDTSFVDPSKKPEDVKPDTKRLFFINRVFLDPLTRELLIALADRQ
jgi:hypothetical protein